MIFTKYWILCCSVAAISLAFLTKLQGVQDIAMQFIIFVVVATVLIILAVPIIKRLLNEHEYVCIEENKL